MNISISFIALNRMVEERAATDETYRRQLKRNRKCTLSDGRALADEVLLEKLQALGLKEANRDWLDRVSRSAPSAQALATALTEPGALDVPADQEDWIWISLVCLWERWFPDRPNFEMLDDGMQSGYAAQERDEPLETARLWLQVWGGMEHLMKTFEIETIEEFDERFKGTQSVFNWVQDFSIALHDAALRDPSFAQQRLAICRRLLALAEKSEREWSLRDEFRRDLAEAHADLGEYETVDRLYTEWLRGDPRWGWGWIGWSNAYSPFAPAGPPDAAKAERILHDGLAVSDVRDREYLLEHLASLYEETGRSTEAHALRRRHEDSLHVGEERPNERRQKQRESDLEGEWALFREEDRFKSRVDETPGSPTRIAEEEGRPDFESNERRAAAARIRNTGPIVGRNDRCPCGSGKKYKKCCGAR